MSQPLAPKGGNDRVYTPPALAKAIVDHFKPSGMLLEPCAGKGAFVEAMYDYSDTGYVSICEIDEGLDFLANKAFLHDLTHPAKELRYDWTITNPPWSKFRAFLNKAMEVSDNVVFLCLVNAFFMKARQEDMRKRGFGMKEILFVPTPPKPWPQTGFSLGAVHIQRHYHGPVTLSYLQHP